MNVTLDIKTSEHCLGKLSSFELDLLLSIIHLTQSYKMNRITNAKNKPPKINNSTSQYINVETKCSGYTT